MIRALLASTLLALSVATLASAQSVDIDAGTLTVTGTATQEVENNAAQVSFGVQIRQKTSSEAVAENTRLLSVVFDEIQKLGIAKQDMQTSGIRLRQVLDETGGIIGYEMNNNVSIHVSDIATLGDVLTAATVAGVNRIDNVEMVPSKDAVDMDALRVQAAGNAQAKAALYAEALGLKIVGIQSVTEQGLTPTPIYAQRNAPMAVSSAVPIAGGTSQSSQTVQVAYLVELAEPGAD